MTQGARHGWGRWRGRLLLDRTVIVYLAGFVPSANSNLYPTPQTVFSVHWLTALQREVLDAGHLPCGSRRQIQSPHFILQWVAGINPVGGCHAGKQFPIFWGGVSIFVHPPAIHSNPDQRPVCRRSVFAGVGGVLPRRSTALIRPAALSFRSVSHPQSLAPMSRPLILLENFSLAVSGQNYRYTEASRTAASTLQPSSTG